MTFEEMMEYNRNRGQEKADWIIALLHKLKENKNIEHSESVLCVG